MNPPARADYGIGGDGLPREGFDAILGVSMRGSDAPSAATNPLSVIGSRHWIVIPPEPGTAAPGRLIINPGGITRPSPLSPGVRLSARSGRRYPAHCVSLL